MIASHEREKVHRIVSKQVKCPRRCGYARLPRGSTTVRLAGLAVSTARYRDVRKRSVSPNRTGKGEHPWSSRKRVETCLRGANLGRHRFTAQVEDGRCNRRPHHEPVSPSRIGERRTTENSAREQRKRGSMVERIENRMCRNDSANEAHGAVTMLCSCPSASDLARRGIRAGRGGL